MSDEPPVVIFDFDKTLFNNEKRKEDGIDVKDLTGSDFKDYVPNYAFRLISYLKNNGVKVAIVTNSNRNKHLNTFLETLKERHHIEIDAVVSFVELTKCLLERDVCDPTGRHILDKEKDGFKEAEETIKEHKKPSATMGYMALSQIFKGDKDELVKPRKMVFVGDKLKDMVFGANVQHGLPQNEYKFLRITKYIDDTKDVKGVPEHTVCKDLVTVYRNIRDFIGLSPRKSLSRDNDENSSEKATHGRTSSVNSLSAASTTAVAPPLLRA